MTIHQVPPSDESCRTVCPSKGDSPDPSGRVAADKPCAPVAKRFPCGTVITPRVAFGAPSKQRTEEERAELYERVLRIAENAKTDSMYREIISVLHELEDYKDARRLIEEYQGKVNRFDEYKDTCRELERASNKSAVERIKKAHPHLHGFIDFDACVEAALMRVANAEAAAVYASLVESFNTASADPNAKEENFTKLGNQFKAIKTYKDAAAYADRCRAEARRIKEEKERIDREAAEANNRNAADKFDTKVRNLAGKPKDKRSKAWCTDVRKLPGQITDAIRPYIQTADLALALQEDAAEIERRLKAEFDASVQAFKTQIQNLEREPRTLDWCNRVTECHRNYATRTAEFKRVTSSVSNILDNMFGQVTYIQKAAQFDTKIRTLYGQSHTEAWCTDVIRLHGEVSARVQPYLHEQTKLNTMYSQAQAERSRIAEERRKRERRKKQIRFARTSALCLLPFLIMTISRLIRRESVLASLIFTVTAAVYILLRWFTEDSVGLTVLLASLVNVGLGVALHLGQHGVVIAAFACMLISTICSVPHKSTFRVSYPALAANAFLPAVMAALPIAYALYPLLGLWSFVIGGALAGLAVTVFIILIWNDRDQATEAGQTGFVASGLLTIMGVFFLFANRELAYFALPLLIVNLGNTIASIVALCSDYENGIAFGAGLPLSAVITGFLITCIVFCTAVRGNDSIQVKDDTVFYHLDMTDGTYRTDRPIGCSVLGLVNAPHAETIIVDNGFTHIREKAFSDCHNLQKIYIPSDVKDLDENIFRDCQNLKTIYIGYESNGSPSSTPSQLSVIGVNIFRASVDVPVRTIYYNGTKKMWSRVIKEVYEEGDWTRDMGDFTVICNDGTVKYTPHAD